MELQDFMTLVKLNIATTTRRHHKKCNWRTDRWVNGSVICNSNLLKSIDKAKWSGRPFLIGHQISVQQIVRHFSPLSPVDGEKSSVWSVGMRHVKMQHLLHSKVTNLRNFEAEVQRATHCPTS